MERKEIVETKFDMNKGNYIPNICYEFEDSKYIIFSRKEDGKIVSISRNVIKGSYTKDKYIPQEIRLMPYFTDKLYWKEYYY